MDVAFIRSSRKRISTCYRTRLFHRPLGVVPSTVRHSGPARSLHPNLLSSSQNYATAGGGGKQFSKSSESSTSRQLSFSSVQPCLGSTSPMLKFWISCKNTTGLSLYPSFCIMPAHFLLQPQRSKMSLIYTTVELLRWEGVHRQNDRTTDSGGICSDSVDSE
jgi:hypothetical protein